jgi:hypothetical protein
LLLCCALLCTDDLTNTTTVDSTLDYTLPISWGLRKYLLTCSTSREYLDTGYSYFPIGVAIGIGALFFVNLLILALSSSCLDLRRALRRTDELAEVHLAYALQFLIVCPYYDGMVVG